MDATTSRAATSRRAASFLSERLPPALVRLWRPRPGVAIRLRTFWPLVWPAGLIVAALLLPDRVWTTLLVGLGGLTLIAYGWTRALAGGLSARRRLRFGWVSVGDRLEEEFALRNRSGLPALWVEIRDDSTVPGYRAAGVRSVGANSEDRWRQSAVCRRRGHYLLGPWSLHSGDPFGLFSVVVHYPATEEIIIHPPIAGRLPIPLPPGRSEGRTKTRERSWQATINAAAVRPYDRLDPFHWIHWPTSARHSSEDGDNLYVRQFDRDAAGDLWLLIDCRAAVQLGEGADGTEEHAVLLAAALAGQALRETRGVGLVAYGKEPQIVVPGLGQGQQWRILRGLALLEADGETDLARAMRELAQNARRGAAAVIITPAGDGDWLPDLLTLARRGVESHVVLLDRPSFGGEGNSEGLRQAVSLLGFRSHVIRRGDITLPEPEQERRGFWEFKVTGTGKAVAVRRPGD